MLFVENKRVEKESAHHTKILNRWGNNWVAKAYLESIMKAKSQHNYKSLESLGFVLTMASLMEKSAMIVGQQVELDTENVTLDNKYWDKIGEGEFQCKNEDYAVSVDGILKDKSKNSLECLTMAHLITLNALLLAVKAPAFNQILKEELKKKKEPLKLPVNDCLIQTEVLNYPGLPGYSYEGDRVFRPGDIVEFVNNMPEAFKTWVFGVENAVCVSWMPNKEGGPNFMEPIFVGGGINHFYGSKEGQPKFLTESQMREQIWRETIYTIPLREEFKRRLRCPAKKPKETLTEENARKKCEADAKRRANISADQKRLPDKLKILFAKKALDLPAGYDPDGKTPYSIYPHLHPIAQRFLVFGGRKLP